MKSIVSTLLLTLTAINLNAAITALYFESSPTSWVGRGETVYVTPAQDYDFNITINLLHILSFWISNTDTVGIQDDRWWSLDLATPNDEPFAVGMYTDTARYPFQDDDQPGLTFYGNGRGNNRNGGFFEVLEVAYDNDDKLVKLAVDFTQYGEQNPARWINGKLRYNSMVPIPEPAIAPALLGLAALIACRRR